MIFAIARRGFPLARKFLHNKGATHTSRAFFSRVDKFNEFRSTLELEIEEENANKVDLSPFEADFKAQGWKLKKEDTLIELWKRVDDHDVRLLASIRAPTDFDGQQKEQIEKEMNEVTICVTKLGSFRTMTLHAIVTDGYQIGRITFAPNYEHIKEHRLQLYSKSEYNGPEIQTLPENLYSNINIFLSEELGVTNSLLSTLAKYSLESEHSFYIGWLKDLKNLL